MLKRSSRLPLVLLQEISVPPSYNISYRPPRTVQWKMCTCPASHLRRHSCSSGGIQCKQGALLVHSQSPQDLSPVQRWTLVSATAAADCFLLPYSVSEQASLVRQSHQFTLDRDSKCAVPLDARYYRKRQARPCSTTK